MPGFQTFFHQDKLMLNLFLNKKPFSKLKKKKKRKYCLPTSNTEVFVSLFELYRENDRALP